MSVCSKCKKSFSPLAKTLEKFRLDGLCGKCRSKKVYVDNVDKYRKIKKCPSCGKKILNISKMCNSCSQIGKHNHQWKEVKVDRGIYTTLGYKKWRAEVLAQNNNQCAVCKKTYRLAAHHIFPKRDFPEKQFEVTNGVALCHKCHSKVQKKEYEYIDYFTDLVMPK